MNNAILSALHTRKSVRVFTDQPITADERAAILEAAFQAPVRREAEVALRVGYVAVPVALAHDAVLVAIQRRGFALKCGHLLGHYRRRAPAGVPSCGGSRPASTPGPR